MEKIFEKPAIKNKIEKLYPGIFDVPEVDVDEYMKYCDEYNPTAKNYQSFKKFNEMKEKCRKKGLESILFRKDVINVSKGHYKEGWNDGHDVEYDYIEVATEYGNFRVTKGNCII